MIRVFCSLFFAVLFFASCSPEPEPIIFGKEECVFCKMTISQKQWGAEIVTNKSKTIKFDAIECMAKYLNDGFIRHEEIHSFWIIDYSNPGTLVNTDKAVFLRSKTLPSPMAMFLTGFSNQSNLKATMLQHKGQVLTWLEVLSVVKKEWE